MIRTCTDTPTLSTGRTYATWRIGGVFNANLRKEAKVNSNFAYRKYMTSEADTIISYNQQIACNQLGVCPERRDYTASNNQPYLYPSPLSLAKPPGYETSDLKEQYLRTYRNDARASERDIPAEDIHKLKGILGAGAR